MVSPSHSQSSRNRKDSRPTISSIEAKGNDAASSTVYEKPPSQDDSDHVNYQTMNWFHLGLLMLAETVSLGILSLPWAIAQIGFREGVTITILAGLLATYTGYVYGQFKLAYPHCSDAASAGEILGQALPWKWAAPVLREFTGISAQLVLIFLQAAHVVSFALMMHGLAPNNKTCAIVWYALGAFVQFVCTIPRTMRMTSYVSFLSTISVFIATTMVMADVGRKFSNDPLGAAMMPAVISFSGKMTALLNITGSYAGHVAYLSFASELKNPRDFNKALFFQLSCATVLYTIVGSVVYYYVGPSVKAPALSSASPKISKAAWGVASMTIVAAGVVNAHVSSKYVYTRFFKNIMHKRSFKSYATWIGIVAANWTLSWLFAELIPSFQHMLAVVSALNSAWFTFSLSGLLWFNINWSTLRTQPNVKIVCLALINVSIILLGAFLSIAGMYANVMEMKEGMTGKIFSCSIKT